MKILKTTIKHTEHYQLASGYYSRVNEFSIPEEDSDNIKWYQEVNGTIWKECPDPFVGRVRPDSTDRKIIDTEHLVLKDDKEYMRSYCSSPEKITWHEDVPTYYSTETLTWVETVRVVGDILEGEFQELMNKKSRK